MPRYRLTLDVPYDFAVEPGFQGGRNAGHFRATPDSASNVWLCPASNVLMLKPNVFARNWHDDLMQMSEFRLTSESGFWAEVTRAATESAKFLSSLKPSDKSFSLIEALSSAAIMLVEASGAVYDDLKWVAHTKAQFAVDEGFVFHYRGLTDELARKQNWFALQWDNIGLHFSMHGDVRVYEYDRAHLDSEPTLVHEFRISGSGDLLNQSLWITLLPIPNKGLAVYFSAGGRKRDGLLTALSVDARGVDSAHLIPWKTRRVGGVDRLFDASAVSIALNPYHRHLWNLQRLRFPEEGSFTDGIFDIGYKPSGSPVVSAQNVGRGSVSVEARKTDDSAVWATGARQGRVKMTLSTADTKYSPIVTQYFVGWEPVMAERTTTPYQITSFQALEYSIDENLRYEGRASVFLSDSTGKAICDRGDTTFLLEGSVDHGATWTTVFGGLAKEFEVDRKSDLMGDYYDVTFGLYDMWERLNETHRWFDTAVDGQTFSDAINNVLIGSMFAPIASSDMPAEFATKTLPPIPADSKWRFAPKLGDKCADMLETILLLGRAQGIEYRMWFDWDAATWKIQRKPAPTELSLAELVATSAAQDAGALKFAYASLRTTAEPPEANIIFVNGRTDTDTKGSQIVATLANKASLEDTSSVDYLGRSVMIRVPVEALARQEDANLIARRLYDAVAHRRVKCTVDLFQYVDELVPMRPVRVLDKNGATLAEGWIKRKSHKCGWLPAGAGTRDTSSMTLEIDTVWAGEVKRA